MKTIDPIFVAPRHVAADWGRCDLGVWTTRRLRPAAPVGETWVHHPANSTVSGPLGRRLSTQSEMMLGDLGRAPPHLRLVFPGERAKLASTAPLSLWTILEAGDAGTAPSGGLPYRQGERIRAYEGAALDLPAGSVALEVSAAFMPKNASEDAPSLVRLPPVSRRMRATLFRDEALSVELWTLPETSRISPDGETCHVLTALSAGVVLDGHPLAPGHAVFVPAWGRPFDLTGANGKVLVAYPDQAPTDVWRHSPGPDPTSGQLPAPAPSYPPATLERQLVDIAA